MPPRKPKPNNIPTPPAPKPWDIRPITPTGSPSEGEIYHAVGEALSKWEFAEIQLSDLYLCFIGAYYGNPYGNSPRTPALRAYGAVVGFSTRIEMVETAGRTFFNQKRRHLKDRETDARVVEYEKRVSDDLPPLVLELRGFVARRNEIAHGLVGGRNGCFFLNPPDYNPRKNPLSTVRRTIFDAAIYHYTAEDIEYYCRNFQSLARKILDYIERVLRVVRHDRSRDEENRAEDERHRLPRR